MLPIDDRALPRMAAHLDHVKSLVSASMSLALALLAPPSTSFSIMFAAAFLLRVEIKHLYEERSRNHNNVSQNNYPKYSGPAVFLRSTPPDAILRTVPIAHRPFAPACELRQLRRFCRDKSERVFSIEMLRKFVGEQSFAHILTALW